MTWMSAASAGLNIAGGLMGGSSAKKAAAAAAAERRATANTLWQSSRFRPVGTTNTFGTSNFQQDSEGNLISAGYTLSPEYQAMQNQLTQQSGRNLDYADQVYGMSQGLFGLGQQYVGQDPTQTANQWMARQQDIVAPSRERQFAGLQQDLFNKGRGGLAVGATGTRPSGAAGLSASNPQMEAYYNAIAQQDIGFAQQAQQEARNQTQFGVGLFNSGMGMQNAALNPFASSLSSSSNLENLGRTPYDMSMQAATTQAQINGAARSNWANLMNGATAQQQAANAYNPTAAFLSGAGNMMRGMNFGSSGAPTASGVMDAYGNIPSDFAFSGV
jgi:hypothetical protein